MWGINTEVNKLPYVSDPVKYRRDDFWTSIGQSGGDCDDYAVGKLRRLVARGWPIEKLRLACCYTELDEYHAVLIVEGPEADYMLDNRLDSPVPVSSLDEINYKPDRIQEIGGSKKWVQWLK